jgi:glutamine amidotransferase PdxT
MAASFHPELTNDDRIHRLFADMVRGASSSGVTTRDQVR